MVSNGGSRRSVLKAAGVSAVLPLVAGCSRLTASRTPDSQGPLDFAAGWEFRSDEPILDDSALAAEASTGLARGTLVDSEREAARIRWDYLDELHVDAVDHFVDTDFAADEILTVVEVRLPPTHAIRSVDEELVDGTLYATYDVLPADGDSDRPALNNDLTRWRTESSEKPTDVTVELRYDGAVD